MRWHSPPDSVRQRLPERQVVEADVDDRLQPAPDVALGERVDGLGRGQGEHVADRLAVDGQGQHLVLEAAALAGLAGGTDAVQEGQVGVDARQAVAGRAGALGVEAEQPGVDLVRRRERLRRSSITPV